MGITQLRIDNFGGNPVKWTIDNGQFRWKSSPMDN